MKQETVESYERAINRVIDYINAHLYEVPDVATLAALAHLSEYHFHRIFKAIIGENVGEYIVRLRLESIAQRIRLSTTSLESIALAAGYQSKHALAKAFKKHFGLTPSAYRKLQDVELADICKRVSTPLSPEIKTCPRKQLLYIRIVDSYGSPESYRNAWQQLIAFAKEKQLINAHIEYLGLSFDDPSITESERCRFYACLTCSTEVKPISVFGTIHIECGLYAVFTLKGSYNGLMDLYCNIYLRWLPNSSYRLRKGMPYEKYINNPDHVRESDIITEVYIPVEHTTSKDL